MKVFIFVILFFSFNSFAENANDSDNYKDGIGFGKELNVDLKSLSNYDTNNFYEGGFNRNPEETKYYKNEDVLMSEGLSQLNQSELKDAILNAANNKPKITEKNELINDNLNLQNNIVTDSNGNFCFASSQKETIYSEKSCKQDAPEKGICYLKPVVKWSDSESKVDQYTETIPLLPDVNKSGNEFSYFTFNPTYDGTLIHFILNYKQGMVYAQAQLRKKTIYQNVRRSYEWQNYNVFDQNIDIATGKTRYGYIDYKYKVDGELKKIEGTQTLKFTRTGHKYTLYGSGYDYKVPTQNITNEFFYCGSSQPPYSTCRELSITLFMNALVRQQTPVISWERDCDFPISYEGNSHVGDGNKQMVQSDYKLKNNECMIENVDKEYVDEINNTHTIHFPCLEFKETYEKPADPSAECKILETNDSCIKEKEVCEISNEDGECTQTKNIYSCGVSLSTDGYTCGNTFYSSCENNDCDLSSKNGDFGDVISKLQTVTEVANDINESPYDIKIFTGKTLKCRKTAVGYNNCCKDSGWGQDVGIAGCDNEEIELGKAKEKGLVISIGEYCSKDVLGVCIQKKRSYCSFTSKLAKIVQQQGRKSQLNIGFGKAKSPDCRGLSLDEFEKLNFDIMNFSEFYGDLNEQIDLPTEQAIKDSLKVN